MKKLLIKFLSFSLIAAVLSCTINAPIIRETDWDITIIKDLKSGLTYESLSIYLNCYDEDGKDDIDTIFFIDDDNGIYWELNSEEWDEKYINQIKWIGSNSLVMPDRSNIKRSAIRVHVRDRAGETVEGKIYITKRVVDINKITFPELKIENDLYSIKNYKNAKIDIYSENKLLLTGTIDNVPVSFVTIFGQEKSQLDSNIEIFVSVNNSDQILKSGPWY